MRSQPPSLFLPRHQILPTLFRFWISPAFLSYAFNLKHACPEQSTLRWVLAKVFQWPGQRPERVGWNLRVPAGSNLAPIVQSLQLPVHYSHNQLQYAQPDNGHWEIVTTWLFPISERLMMSLPNDASLTLCKASH